MSTYPITADSLRSDHEVRALDRRTDDYKRDVAFGKLLSSYVNRLQDAEGDAWETILERFLDNAEGVQLDNLGKIVGEPRFSANDERYRAAVRLRIAINLCQGTRVNLYRILALMFTIGGELQDFTIIEMDSSVFVHVNLKVNLYFRYWLLSRILGAIRPGGIRLQLIAWDFGSETFEFSDNDTSEEIDGTGWADLVSWTGIFGAVVK